MAIRSLLMAAAILFAPAFALANDPADEDAPPPASPSLPPDAVVGRNVVLCRDVEPLLENLKKEYEEMPIASAASEDRGANYIFTRQAKEDGSFTILMLRPDGKACVLAAGHNWHWLPYHSAPSTKD